MDNLESSAEKRTSAQDSGSVAGDPDALAGYDSDVSLPSVSELRQCELEVGALLKVIADLNAKMGSLQAPSVGSSDRCNSLGRASCSTPAYSPSSPVAPAHYPPSSPLPPAFYPSMPGTTPDFHPSPGSIDFQPNPGSIDFQPSTGSPDFHPNPGSPAFHLSTGSPAFQYNPGLLDYSFPGLRNYSSMPGGSQAFYPSSGPPDGTLSPGCAPDYAPNPVPRSHPEEVPGIRSGTPALLLNRRGSGEVWAELQEALSTLERSASKGRSYTPVPQPIRDEEIRTQHLSAARDSWVRVTQVLEEMERDLGFSYRSALPPEERRHYQQEVLELHRLNRGLRGALQSRQQELSQSDTSLHDLEDDKKKLQEKLLVLKRRWLVVGSLSPPRSPSSCSSSGGAVSPFWGVSSPPFPASPLLLRRHPAAFPPAATGGDLSPSSPCPSPVPFSSSSAASPCPPGMDSETERLQRCLERLKARNERLSAALERRKGESEQISMALSRHEADNTALQMALTYCEECEENYVKLLELYEHQREQDVMETTDGPASWSPSADGEAAEELQSGRQTAEGAAPMGNSTHSSSAAAGEEVFSQQVWGLKERIGGLRRDRAALHIPDQGPQGGAKMSPDTGTLAGPRGQSSSITSSNNSTRGEKAALLYELVTVREEMSELRGAIRLTEKEKRCLEWTLVSQRAQDEAGALLIDSLRDELDHRSMEQQRESRSRERSNSGGGRGGGGGGGGIPGPRNRTILRELQAISQRDQVMRRRMIGLRDSLDTRLSDSMALRRHTEEEVTRLTHAHSKISNVYRNARRKHREQIWRLEKQIAALSEHHSGTIAELQHTLNNMEDKREETVL